MQPEQKQTMKPRPEAPADRAPLHPSHGGEKQPLTPPRSPNLLEKLVIRVTERDSNVCQEITTLLKRCADASDERAGNTILKCFEVEIGFAPDPTHPQRWIPEVAVIDPPFATEFQMECHFPGGSTVTVRFVYRGSSLKTTGFLEAILPDEALSATSAEIAVDTTRHVIVLTLTRNENENPAPDPERLRLEARAALPLFCRDD